MSYEALWYSMYDAGGNPPTCKRYCRLPMDQQWGLTIDLAISLADGAAGWRRVTITKTAEVYWYWPHPLSPTGWWLIPARIDTRAAALNDAAVRCAMRRNGNGRCSSHDAAEVLQAWKRSGAWRRHVWMIIPRHPTQQWKRKATRLRKAAPMSVIEIQDHGREDEDVAAVVEQPPEPARQRERKPRAAYDPEKARAAYDPEKARAAYAAKHPDARARQRGRCGALTLERMLDLRKSGATLNEIAEAAGVTRQAIHQVLAKHGAEVS